MQLITDQFLAPLELYKCKCRSVCLSVGPHFVKNGHNLVNFDARSSRFCMEVDLDNLNYVLMMMIMTMMMMII